MIDSAPEKDAENYGCGKVGTYSLPEFRFGFESLLGFNLL